MVKVRKSILPHHVKERLRHQKLQKQLSQIADQVPKPFAVKKETKDTKLRRMILYLKYLRKKLQSLVKEKGQGELRGNFATNCQIKKVPQKTLKLFSHPAKSQAQIIFLKNPGTTKKNELLCKKQEAMDFIKCEKDLEISIPCVAPELDTCSIIDLRTSVTGKDSNSCEKNCNKNDVNYITNGDAAQFLTQKEQSKDLNNEVNSDSQLYENILHAPFSSDSSVVRNSATNTELGEKHFERSYLSDENVFNFTELSQFSNPLTKSYAPVKEYSGVNRYCFPDSSHCHCGDNAALPPVTTFLPQNSWNLRNEESNYYFNQPSCQIRKTFMNSENNLFHNIQEREQGSSNTKMSPSDQAYTSDLVSSGESIITYFSNEWVSDDTITDSSSVKDVMDSPINQGLDYNKHLINNEFFCGPNLSTSKSSEVKFKLSHNRADFDKVFKPADLHSTNILNKACEKAFASYPKNTAPLPFVVQKKRENFGNDDCCVPQSNCEISADFKEINDLDNETNYHDISNCNVFPRKQIKKEPGEYLLPAEEISFSFKNFSQWCPDSFHNVS